MTTPTEMANTTAVVLAVRVEARAPAARTAAPEQPRPTPLYRTIDSDVPVRATAERAYVRGYP